MAAPLLCLPVSHTVPSMPVPVLISRGWPLLALAGLVSLAPDAYAQRVSARDKVKVDALQQRMTAAEKRYGDALLLVANADPTGSNEADAALEDMEDVISECVKQKGCQMGSMLATYKRLLKRDADAASDEDATADAGDRRTLMQAARALHDWMGERRP